MMKVILLYYISCVTHFHWENWVMLKLKRCSMMLMIMETMMFNNVDVINHVKYPVCLLKF